MTDLPPASKAQKQGRRECQRLHLSMGSKAWPASLLLQIECQLPRAMPSFSPRLLLGMISLALLAACHTPEQSTRPNILFIAIDDLRPDLACYGHPVVQSPHLDQLAEQGCFFNRHFVNVPTCGSSRHCMLTSKRPLRPDQLKNNISARTFAGERTSAGPETFIHHLRQNGYYTVGIGKISHSADGYVYGYTDQPSNKRELPQSWDELRFNAGKWETGWNAFFGYANGENRQGLAKQVYPYEKGAVSDTGYVDGLTANEAIAALSELANKNQPFLLGVGFFKPHLPFTSPAPYWDLYEREQIPLSPKPGIPENISLKSLHPSSEFNQYALGEEKASLERPVSDAYTRKVRHAYYAAISYVDAQVGKVLEALEAEGLAENTIVVVWGDHGWHLGDQRVWGKHTIFENALRSTLIIKAPGFSHSEAMSHIVESMDIYPTLMDLCGIQPPDSLEGNSFAGLIQKNEAPSDTVAYAYFRQGISVRTPRYRLSKYYRTEAPQIELYDHQLDPHETENIAATYPGLVEQLMPILEEGDTGLYARK